MIDKELVKACYRAILGREPESEAVVAEKIRWIPNAEALIRDLLSSEEFQERPIQRIGDYNHSAPAPIEVDMSRPQRKALFDRLRSQWSALGEQDPFWSVLTHEEYRASSLDDKTVAEFYDTGAEHAQLIDVFCARNKVEIDRGTCLEIGSGVGRVTKHLAARFEKVVAIDISEGNLRESQAMAEKAGIRNIEHRLLRSPDELESLAPFDFLFSLMVLQHNPPPIQKYQLDAFLSKLRPGGGFLFQTQCFHPAYAFSIEEYLASPVDTMDMHSLPMHVILELIEKYGCRVREVSADMFTGRFGSYTFFGLARPA